MRREGKLVGVPAVIDKDFASALLARLIDADMLIILTAVEQVAVNFGTPQQRGLAALSPDEARAYIGQGQFAPGSMLPKVEAAISFAESKRGRRRASSPAWTRPDGLRGKRHADRDVKRRKYPQRRKSLRVFACRGVHDGGRKSESACPRLRRGAPLQPPYLSRRREFLTLAGGRCRRDGSRADNQPPRPLSRPRATSGWSCAPARGCGRGRGAHGLGSTDPAAQAEPVETQMPA